MQEENEATPITSVLESSTSSARTGEEPSNSGWLKVGAVAVASALAGGLAAAWYYRKTLARLRQTDSPTRDLDFNNPGEGPGEDD
jgi:hypothetical protein